MAAVGVTLGVIQKLKNFYDRLIANHKLPKIALLTVMPKLLGFMNVST